ARRLSPLARGEVASCPKLKSRMSPTDVPTDPLRVDEPIRLPNKNAMDRFIDSIELIAAVFVGIVALNTFVAVFMRKFFAVTIPDYYDFGRLLLGILIFWGIAATSYRGTHITVDLVWANASPRYQRLIDIFATLVLLFVVTVQTITLFDKVTDTYASNIQTFDLHL